jgi:hypothetical protein
MENEVGRSGIRVRGLSLIKSDPVYHDPEEELVAA